MHRKGRIQTFKKILGCKKSNCVLLCQLLIIQCMVVGLEYSYRKKSLQKDEYHQLSTFSAWASFHSFWKQFSTHSLTQQKFFSHFQQRSSQLPCSSILSGYIGSPRVFPAPYSHLVVLAKFALLHYYYFMIPTVVHF